MKRQCVYCVPPHDMGEVAPFDNQATTSGMCAAAEKIENEKVDTFSHAKPTTRSPQ